MRGDRAQTATTGVLFLTAIALLAGATVAVFVLDAGDIVGEESPSAAFEVTADGETVTMRHASGKRIPVSELTLLVRGETDTREIPVADLASGTLSAGDSFTAGPGLPAGRVTVLLRHDPSGSLLVEAVRTLGGGLSVSFDVDASGATSPTVQGGTPGHAPLSLSGVTVAGSPGSEYGGAGQGAGSATLADGGRTLNLSGNGWRSTPYDYVVTGDTVLAFEFRRDPVDLADIQGVALDSDAGISNRQTFQVDGEQNWGIDVPARYGVPAYDPAAGWRSYTLDVTDHGSVPTRIDRLGFVNDDDSGRFGETARGADSWSAYRNVRLYEPGTDYTYRWTVNGDLRSNERAPTLSVSPGDTVTLTVVDATGATATATETV